MKREKKHINNQYGASLLEVILAIALSLVLIPFMYNQIADMNNSVKDIAIANKIVKSRDNVIEYVRLNQAVFDADDNDGFDIPQKDLYDISPLAHSGRIFKTDTQGSEYTEIFLAYRLNDSDYRTANVAKYIGNDAAIVSDDNIAWSQNWAIGVNGNFGFKPGDLVFHIVHSFSGDDKNKFLHRGTIWNNYTDLKLNQMQRTLDLNNNNIYNVATIYGDKLGDNTSDLIRNIVTQSLEAKKIQSKYVYFEKPVTLKAGEGKSSFDEFTSEEQQTDTTDINFSGVLYVDGDVSEFENITAESMTVNGNGRNITINGDITGVTQLETNNMIFYNLGHAIDVPSFVAGSTIGTLYSPDVETETLQYNGNDILNVSTGKFSFGNWKEPESPLVVKTLTVGGKKVVEDNSLVGDWKPPVNSPFNSLDECWFPGTCDENGGGSILGW